MKIELPVWYPQYFYPAPYTYIYPCYYDPFQRYYVWPW